jgi:hypothetical protein
MVHLKFRLKKSEIIFLCYPYIMDYIYHKYKYNKYASKNNKYNMKGGGFFGCCSGNCFRNANLLTLSTNSDNIFDLICCDLCLSGNHTLECNNKQIKENFCVCKRFINCGLNPESGSKFTHCCSLCPTNTHTEECEIQNQKILAQLHSHTNVVAIAPKTKKISAGKPLDKSLMVEFNETFKTNNMEKAIEILRARVAEPDGINENVKGFINRVLNFCAQENQTPNNINAGLNFFVDVFLNKSLFPLDDATFTNGLRLMQVSNADLDSVYMFTEKIFREIEVSRRVLAILFLICAKNKDLKFCMNLLRFGIIKNIIFNKEDYDSVFNTFDLSKHNIQDLKKYTIEIITYMRNQDYLTADYLGPITQNTADILRQIFSTNSQITHMSPLVCSCSNCGNSLPVFNLDIKEKQNMLNFMENTQTPHFKTMVDYIMANPAEIIIDGANVGYQEEKDKGKVKMVINYVKIDMIIKKFLPKSIIIFLHNRHQKNVTSKDQILIDNWIKSGVKICWTPYNMNDDISWMYATLYNDAMLVSNDEMRDHYVNIYSKISPVNFKLWKELHQIQYEFVKGNIVELRIPPKCLPRIQTMGNFWHFYLGDSKWLCLNVA